MGRAEDYKGVRRTITFPQKMFSDISEMAAKENRPFSQMVIKLLLDQLTDEVKTE